MHGNGVNKEKSMKRSQSVVMARRAEKRASKDKHQVQKEKHANERVCNLKPLSAKNDNQKLALKALSEKQLVVLLGPAGTGKTELMCWHTAARWLKNEIDDIFVCRPYKGLGDDYGATPGNDFEKLLPFTMSALLKYKKYLGVGVLKNMLRTEPLELLFSEKSGMFVLPVEKMQGYSINERSAVCLDEGQNMTINQAKSLVTRAERGCQVIISGDVAQSAIGANNGLAYLLKKIKENPHPDIAVIEFKSDENCREGVSKHFTQIFEKEGGIW